MTTPAPSAEDQAHWLSRRVGEKADGSRLDRFLADQAEVRTRSVARLLVDNAAVSVDGAIANKAGAPLAEGQRVQFRNPKSVPRPSRAAVLPPLEPRRELSVVYEDAFMLVIDKPVGLVAHRPEHARGPVESVADLALAHCGTLPTLSGADRPGIVHRLDKDTTGIMVVAKTDEAFHFLKAQFKARTTKKEYRAITYGEPRFDSDYIDRNIAVHPSHGDRMTVVQEGGKEATTYYEALERFVGFTDFRCRPRTGRTHQIRVHMTSIGHSLIGDRVYRSRNHAQAALPEEAPDPQRQCLHAERLEVAHPQTHEPICFEAPLPDDMRLLLHWLRSHRARS